MKNNRNISSLNVTKLNYISDFLLRFRPFVDSYSQPVLRFVNNLWRSHTLAQLKTKVWRSSRTVSSVVPDGFKWFFLNFFFSHYLRNVNQMLSLFLPYLYDCVSVCSVRFVTIPTEKPPTEAELTCFIQKLSFLTERKTQKWQLKNWVSIFFVS